MNKRTKPTPEEMEIAGTLSVIIKHTADESSMPDDDTLLLWEEEITKALVRYRLSLEKEYKRKAGFVPKIEPTGAEEE